MTETQPIQLKRRDVEAQCNAILLHIACLEDHVRENLFCAMRHQWCMGCGKAQPREPGASYRACQCENDE